METTGSASSAMIANWKQELIPGRDAEISTATEDLRLIEVVNLSINLLICLYYWCKSKMDFRKWQQIITSLFR